MMKLEKLSNEINTMKREMKIKSEILFKELFKQKLEKWLVMDDNGNIFGYIVDDVTDDDWEFMKLQNAIYELIDTLKWELLDWRIFPYEEQEISLERGGMVINVKNELFHIDLFLENFFEIR